MSFIPLDTTCVLNERWSVEPFNGQFPNPEYLTELVTYQVGFEYKPYSITKEQNLTVISFQHDYLWIGGEEDFANWGRGKGGVVIALDISILVNRLVDLVHSTFVETDDNPFPYLRHVGFRDFVSLNTLYGDKKQNLISYGMVGMDPRLAIKSSGRISKINFSTSGNVPHEKIKLIRAVELLNSGYHTEAMLISFSILEHSVQQALKTILDERNIDQSRNFLEGIHGRRTEKFLDTLLKTLTGHSLKEDDQKLWVKLRECNQLRNQAVHESIEVKYDDAKFCIETVRDILVYLSSIPRREPINGSSENVLPDLDLPKLPFLLDY